MSGDAMSEREQRKLAASGRILAVSWGLTFLLAYGLLGGWVGSAIEGMDRSLI